MVNSNSVVQVYHFQDRAVLRSNDLLPFLKGKRFTEGSATKTLNTHFNVFKYFHIQRKDLVMAATVGPLGNCEWMVVTGGTNKHRFHCIPIEDVEEKFPDGAPFDVSRHEIVITEIDDDSKSYVPESDDSSSVSALTERVLASRRNSPVRQDDSALPPFVGSFSSPERPEASWSPVRPQRSSPHKGVRRVSRDGNSVVVKDGKIMLCLELGGQKIDEILRSADILDVLSRGRH
jgi:hypothetical protein